MKSATIVAEPELANGWPTSRVENCLGSADATGLISFLKKRHEERFFKPIKTLRSAPKQHQGFGFAIMALCSLLIETFQCYREGLPTTDGGELKRLADFAPPSEYAIPRSKSGEQVFVDFFAMAKTDHLFTDVDGATFYRAIRNGLLHQAQTKQGWRIRRFQSKLWDSDVHIIDRDKFVDDLIAAFDVYLGDLRLAGWDDDLWKMARRKIWWLIKLSV
jgi:hypothetical protein